jgi:eukaryotic-like serine/threonine-protein kinase
VFTPDSPYESSPDGGSAHNRAGTRPLLDALREAVGARYEVIGELGATPAGDPAFLARRPGFDRLVVLLVSSSGTGKGERFGEFTIEEHASLDGSLPTFGVTCNACGEILERWAPHCGACGAETASQGELTGDKSSAALGSALRDAVGAPAAEHYEVVGKMALAGSAGVVHFARDRVNGDLAALRPFPQATHPDTRAAFAVNVTPVKILRRATTTLSARTADSTPPPAHREEKICVSCNAAYPSDMIFCPKDGSTLRPGTPGLIGRVLADRYHVVRLLGRGGMGEVYLAEQLRMGRSVALKVMRPALLNDQDAATRFAREASTVSRITHPHIATVYDCGETPDGIVYLAMEYVPGETLAAILAREGRFPPDRAVRLTRQIAEALQAAHDVGLAHRDLKPDNVMVTRTQRGAREIVKVVDFGIAKALRNATGDDVGHTLTQTGVMLGTPAYMSPEQIAGDSIDGRTDIYSLGCILYELLTGEQTILGVPRERLFARRLAEPPPHPRTRNTAISPALDEIVARALARSPGERFQAAVDLDAALDTWEQSQGNLPRQAARPTTPEPGPADQLAPASDALVASRRPARLRRRRTMVVVAGSVVTIAAFLTLLARDRAARRTAAVSVASPTDSATGQRTPVIARDSVVAPRRDSTSLKALAREPQAASQPVPSTRTEGTPVGATSAAKRRDTTRSRVPVHTKAATLADATKPSTSGQTSLPIAPLTAPSGATVVAPAPANTVVEPPAGSTAKSTPASAAESAHAPTPVPASSSAAATLPSTGANRETTSVASADEVAQAGEVIGAYVAALSHGDMGHMKQLYPAMTDSDQRRYKAFSQGATDFSATLTEQPVPAVHGRTAVVVFGYVIDFYVPGQGPGHVAFRYRASLSRTGDGWQIEQLTKLP